MNKRFLWLSAVLLALSVGVMAARAQVVFTFTATADATVEGYNIGQSYTFVFTTAASYPANPYTTFSSTNSYWGEEQLADPALFTGVTGTGLGGAYVRSSDPYSAITISHPNSLGTMAGSDFETIGLTTLTGTGILFVNANVNLSTVAFLEVLPAEYTDIPAYFSTYAGNYTPSGTISLTDAGYSTLASFNVTNFSISTSAVPEPSTYAALAGLLALGTAAWRRRRRSALLA